jgi:peptide/nickel transport system permease protein
VRQLILRRLVAFLATLFVVSLLVFTVIRVLPGDPALLVMGMEASPEAAAALRRAMGLDRPILVQYAEWLGGALRGDLGRSIQYDVAVGRLIVSRLAVTLPLTLLAATFMMLTAVPLGVYAATRQGRPGDYVAMVLSQLGIAIPSFWAGLLLILLFAVRLGWVQAGFARCSCRPSRSGSSRQPSSRGRRGPRSSRFCGPSTCAPRARRVSASGG